MNLDFPAGPSVIVQVLMRGRQEGQKHWRCDVGSRGQRGVRGGPWPKEHGRLLEARKARKWSPSEALRRNIALWHLTWDIWLPEQEYNKSVLGASKFVVPGPVGSWCRWGWRKTLCCAFRLPDLTVSGWLCWGVGAGPYSLSDDRCFSFQLPLSLSVGESGWALGHPLKHVTCDLMWAPEDRVMLS